MQKRKNVTRFFAVLMAALMLFAAAGCSKAPEDAKTDDPGTDKKAETTTDDGKAMKGNMYVEGLPIVKEKVTLNFMGMQMNNTRVGRWDETDLMKKFEEETNVKIVWEAVPQASWQEKKNLAVASRQLPDAFVGAKTLTMDEAQKFGAEGVLIPLNDLIEEYAPTVNSVLEQYPFYKTFTTSLDGNIYALARMEDLGFDSLSSAIIRTEWLDALGLEMPTTTDEFYEVLKAFKTQDPNKNGEADEIPFSFLYIENPPNREVKREHYWIFSAFGIPDNPLHIAIEDNGELIFTADKERWKEAIEYLHKLYSEGLIDQEVFTQDRTLLTNKIRNELKVGTYTDYRFRFSMASPEHEHRYALMPPLKGPHGDQRWLRALSGYSEGSFAVTSECETPEVVVRWLEYINQPENVVQMNYGMFKPEGYNEKEAMVPSPDAPGKYMTNQAMRPKEINPSDWPFSAPIAVGPTLQTKDIYEKYVAEKASNVAKAETCDVYRPYLTKYPYNYPYKFTVDEIEELSLIQTDLLNYIYKTEAKWIVEGNIDAEWDNYLAQLKKLSVDRYIELYKKSYERSK